MVAGVYIHGTRGIMGVRSICFVGIFTSLSSLLFAFHSEFGSMHSMVVGNWRSLDHKK
jgi:hypothetical protein